MTVQAIITRRDFLVLAVSSPLVLARARAETTTVATRAGDAASRPAADLSPGVVAGRVRFDDEPPVAEILDCSADPQCAQLYRKEPLRSESLLVSEKGGLQNVFVSVARGLSEDRKWKPPAEPVVLDQQGCRYLPHVFGVMAGQPLEIRNSSKINEVPHGYPARNPEFSFTLSKRGMSQTVVLTEPETFKIECDVHPWELAWCHVMAHPFFAVTDSDGRFRLPALAAGQYELTFWHEHGSLGTQTRMIEVGPDSPVRMDEVTFKRRKQRGPRPQPK